MSKFIRKPPDRQAANIIIQQTTYTCQDLFITILKLFTKYIKIIYKIEFSLTITRMDRYCRGEHSSPDNERQVATPTLTNKKEQQECLQNTPRIYIYPVSNNYKHKLY